MKSSELAAGLFFRKVCLVDVSWCSGNTCVMTHLFELWIYAFHAIWRIWGSDMLKSIMIYSLQTSALPWFFIYADGIRRTFPVLLYISYWQFFYCILLCSFHCEVHEHAKHMTFFQRGVYFFLDKAWKSTTIFWKMIKKPLLKYGCFGNQPD